MIKTLKKYTAFYLLFLRMNFSQVLDNRMGFFNDMLSSFIWSFFSIFTLVIITAKTKVIFGWTREELLILAAMYNVFIGFFHFLFSGNFNEFINVMHFGELDTVLTKPVDTQFLLSFRYVRYNNLLRALIGIVVVITFLFYLHISITLQSVITCFILLCFGIVILYAIWFSILTLTVRYTNLSNLLDFLYTMNSMLRYPKEVYQHASFVIFFLFFPMTILFSTSVRGLLGKVQMVDVLILIITTFIALVLSRLWWKFALRFYTSAGG